MPFETENILFGGEFDNSKLLSGINDTVKGLQSLGAEQNKLQASTEATTQTLTENESELKKLKASYDLLDKSNKSYADSEEKLRSRIDALQKSNDKLNISLNEQQKQLAVVNQTAAKSSEAIAKVDEAAKSLANTVKKPVIPVFDFSNLEQSIGKIKSVFSTVDFTGFDELHAQLLTSKSDVEQFEITIQVLKEKLKELSPGTQEFTDLNEIIVASEKVVTDYNTALAETNETQGQSAKQTVSLRTRIKELRDELTKLEDAQLENTEQYQKTQLEAAKLTDQYGDMQQRIRILASDTKNLDFGLAAINTVATGFQTVTGALELFGLSGEDAAEAQRKLLAIMNLVQGAQQLQNLLLKEGTLRVVGADIATKVFTTTQRVLTSALGVTAGAARTLSAALIATGVGALIVAIGYLIGKLSEWASSTDEAEKAQARLNKTIEEQEKILDNDLKALDFNNKIRLEKIKQAGLSEAAVYLQNKDNRRAQILRLEDELTSLQIQAQYRTGEALTKTQENYQKTSEKLGELLLQDTEEKEKEKTRITDVGRKNQQKVRDQANQDLKAALTLQEQIRNEFALRGLSEENKELLLLKNQYDKDLKVLTKAKQDTMALDQLYNSKREDIAVKYSNLRAEGQKALENELYKITLDASEKRLSLISDEFERERQLAQSNFEKQKEELNANQTTLLNQALKDKLEGIISPAQYEQVVKEISATFDNLFNSLETETAIKLQDIGAAAFQSTLEGLKATFEPLFNNISDEANKALTLAAQNYITGEISFKTYQEQVTEIQRTETDKRLRLQKAELINELAAIDVRSNARNISEKEYNSLMDQRAALAAQISGIDKSISENQVTEHKEQSDENQRHLSELIAQYSSFTNIIVGFLQQLSAAEQQRLDRQISFQKTRVEFARSIAEKGNAEYLELEQKRLDELERKREAAAQRQIAINNALVLSEATLAAITAISKAAAEGGAVNIIASLAAVIATIGAAYNFVNSLQPQSTEFFEGTEYVQQGRHKAGRDTIPARLNIGEAVIPTDTNKDYHKAVKAIYNKQVPADVLNNFVDQYKVTGNIPNVDYGRLSLATDRSLTGNMGETNQKLDLIYEMLGNVNGSLSNLDNVRMTMDENGFSVSLVKHIKKQWLISKS